MGVDRRKVLGMAVGGGLCAGLGVAGSAEAADPVVLSLEPQLHARCVAILKKALGGSEFWPAMHAAEGLTLAGYGADVRAALEPRFGPETDDQHRCGLAREMVRTGDRSRLYLLHEILVRPGSNGHTHAAESLFKVAEVGEGFALNQVLSHPETGAQKLMAAGALARCGNPAALSWIRRTVPDGSRDDARIASWLLGVLGDASDAAPIRARLEKETDALTRAYHLHALALLGDPAGREGLLKNLSHEDAGIRTYAAEFAGWARLTGARSQLVQLLSDATTDVRVRAAQSLLLLTQAPVDRTEMVTNDVYPASPRNPRYSEGSVMVLTDSSLLYSTTEFAGDGADHATAHVVARRSTDGGRSWEPSTVLQENVGAQNVMSSTLRRLTPGRQDGPIGHLYLVKNSAADLHAFLRVSHDEGRRWGPPVRVTQDAGYHVVNNDRLTVLSGGRLICPVSWSEDFQKTGHFIVFCYYSDDMGRTWSRSKTNLDQPRRGAMEPEVIELRDGRLLMIIRTQVGIIASSHSADRGETWSAPVPLGPKAPEAPSTIRRIPATGDLLLVFNNTFRDGVDHGGARTPLTTAISSDEGRTWSHLKNLESDPKEGYAYTSVTFHRDRLLLSYYIHDSRTGRIKSRFRSLPVSWLYSK